MDFLSDAVIEGAEFKGLDVAGKSFRFKEITDTRFVRCQFADTSFEECRFQNCTFTKCDLSMLKVKGSQFSAVRLEGCKALGINWTEATWRKTGLFRLIDFDDCTVNFSSFFGLKLRKMQMTQCMAREVDFGEADLTGADFSRSDLSGSIFMHTNLTEANLVGAANYTIAASNNTLKKTRFALPEALSLLYSLDIVLEENTPT